MRYESVLQLFVCMNGYQQIDDECVQIPKNKIWFSSLNRFVCKANFYQLKDGTCSRLGKHEQYNP